MTNDYNPIILLLMMKHMKVMPKDNERIRKDSLYLIKKYKEYLANGKIICLTEY